MPTLENDFDSPPIVCVVNSRLLLSRASVVTVSFKCFYILNTIATVACAHQI